MESSVIYEVIGYTGVVLLVLSYLLMSFSLVKLRIVYLVGSACLLAYGLLLRTYPIALFGFLLALVALYNLYRLYSIHTYFSLLQMRPDSDYLKSFLRFYDKEIKRFLPDFTFLPNEQWLVVFILHDLDPAGVFIAEPRGGGSLWVHLDFVPPAYRDLNLGHFLYVQQASFLKDKGIRKIFCAAGNSGHAAFLRRQGFAPDSSDPSGALYSRELK